LHLRDPEWRVYSPKTGSKKPELVFKAQDHRTTE